MKRSAPDTILTAIALTSLGALLALTPFIRDPFPLFGNSAGVRVLVSGLEVIFIGAAWAMRTLYLPEGLSRPLIRNLIVTWLLWSLLATLSADHLAAALVRQSEWCMHVGFGLSLYCLLSRRPEMARIVVGIIIIGFLIYATNLIRFILSIPMPEYYDWVGGLPGFTNIRHFSYYAAAMTAFGLYPALLKTTAIRYLLYGSLFSGLCWGLLFWSGGRGGIIAALAATILILPFLEGVARRKVAAIAIIAIGLGLGISSMLDVEDRHLGAERLVAASKDVSSGRTDIWAKTLPRIAEHPLFGSGPDGFLYRTWKTRTAYTHPHNLFLQMADEWGLPGMLFALALLALAAYGIIIKIRKERHEAGDTSIAARTTAAIALFTLLAHSLVDGTLYHAHSLMLGATLLATALHDPAAANRNAPLPNKYGLAALAPLGLIIALHAAVLTVQRTPQKPGSPAIELVRFFPSNIDRITHWTDNWPAESRQEAIALLHWGHEHVRTNKKAKFLFHEGRLLAQEGKTDASLLHLTQALSLAPNSRGITKEIEAIRERATPRDTATPRR